MTEDCALGDSRTQRSGGRDLAKDKVEYGDSHVVIFTEM